MLFNSLHYFIFLPVVVFLFFALPHRFRWVLLLIASCVFYMAFVPEYILILFVVILVDYSVGVGLEKADGKKRKWLLALSISANLGILFFFKFSNFAIANLSIALEAIGIHASLPTLAIVLPIGLSFHVFQSLSYTIEVYYRRQRAETHLGQLAVYVLFFPQMVAGPIERPQNVLPQLRKQQHFSEEDFVVGLRLILFGLFKKVLIADPLAAFCDPVFSEPAAHHGLEHLLATLFFTAQIYFDFSGYSDIALGSARLLGFRLMQNFANPYMATSLRAFWSRWHISLSTWFRDYVYIPMGGNRVSVEKNCLNLVVVFALSGLWHGANWTFVVWGLCHAAGLIVAIFSSLFVARYCAPQPWWPKRTFQAFCWVLTLGFVSLVWVLFRANSISDAFLIYRSMAGMLWRGVGQIDSYFPSRSLIAFAMGVLIILLIEPRNGEAKPILSVGRLPEVIRFATYVAWLLIMINLGCTTEIPFIYFQF